MKPRAALHQSAPSAIARAMSKALTTLPAQPMRTRSRRFRPTSVLCTSSRPSCSGAPMVGELQRRRARAALGAVDDDEVGHDAGLEHGLGDGEPFPRVADASLKPVGLPPEIAQAVDERSISIGVAKALCAEGDAVRPHRHAAPAAISGVTFGPGSTPPWPGLAPWLSLISIIFTCGRRAFSAKRAR